MKKHHNLLWLILPCAIGCSSPENVADVGEDVNDMSDLAVASGSLIDQERWNQTSMESDPFLPPEDAICDAASGIGNESLDGETTIAILTDFCPWATVSQPSLLELSAGDTIDFRIWHFELVGDGPANIAVQIGDWIAVDKQIEKPHKAQLLAETIVVPKAFPSGSQVYFHVDNHGANEYSLVELSKN